MSDGNTEETGTAGPSKGLSSSELESSSAQLRQRRREKILANQSSRMERIMGVVSTVDKEQETVRDEGICGGASDPPTIDVLDWSKPGERIEEEEVDNGVSIIRRRVAADEKSPTTETNLDRKSTHSSMSSGSSTNKSSGSKPKVTFAPSTKPPMDDTPSPKPSRPAMGFLVPQADGSTIHPKLSSRACRILVFLLGIFLSLLNAKYFLVTFFSWEVAVFVINGFPNDEAASNNLILLIALLGMKDAQVQTFKFVLKLCNCLFTDFSILMVSSLTSRVLYETWISTTK